MVSKEPDHLLSSGQSHAKTPAAADKPPAAMTVRSVLLNRDSPDIESRLRRRRNRTHQVRFKDLEDGTTAASGTRSLPRPGAERDSPHPLRKCGSGSSSAPQGWGERLGGEGLAGQTSVVGAVRGDMQGTIEVVTAFLARAPPHPLTPGPTRRCWAPPQPQPCSLTLPMTQKQCNSMAIQTSPCLKKPSSLSASHKRSQSLRDSVGVDGDDEGGDSQEEVFTTNHVQKSGHTRTNGPCSGLISEPGSGSASKPGPGADLGLRDKKPQPGQDPGPDASPGPGAPPGDVTSGSPPQLQPCSPCHRSSVPRREASRRAVPRKGGSATPSLIRRRKRLNRALSDPGKEVEVSYCTTPTQTDSPCSSPSPDEEVQAVRQMHTGVPSTAPATAPPQAFVPSQTDCPCDPPPAQPPPVNSSISKTQTETLCVSPASVLPPHSIHTQTGPSCVPPAPLPKPLISIQTQTRPPCASIPSKTRPALASPSCVTPPNTPTSLSPPRTPPPSPSSSSSPFLSPSNHPRVPTPKTEPSAVLPSSSKPTPPSQCTTVQAPKSNPAQPASVHVTSACETPTSTPVPAPIQSQEPTSIPPPTTTPAPAHAPAPIPTSIPAPISAQASIPASIPVPASTHAPANEASPVPAPIPAQTPAPIPTSIPAPTPAPISAQSSNPASISVPASTHAPAHEASPVPAPTTVPASIPVPALAPIPTPAPAHAPAHTPAPVPTPAATPSQTYLPLTPSLGPNACSTNSTLSPPVASTSAPTCPILTTPSSQTLTVYQDSPSSSTSPGPPVAPGTVPHTPIPIQAPAPMTIPYDPTTQSRSFPAAPMTPCTIVTQTCTSISYFTSAHPSAPPFNATNATPPPYVTLLQTVQHCAPQGHPMTPYSACASPPTIVRTFAATIPTRHPCGTPTKTVPLYSSTFRAAPPYTPPSQAPYSAQDRRGIRLPPPPPPPPPYTPRKEGSGTPGAPGKSPLVKADSKAKEKESEDAGPPAFCRRASSLRHRAQPPPLPPKTSHSLKRGQGLSSPSKAHSKASCLGQAQLGALHKILCRQRPNTPNSQHALPSSQQPSCEAGSGSRSGSGPRRCSGGGPTSGPLTASQADTLRQVQEILGGLVAGARCKLDPARVTEKLLGPNGPLHDIRSLQTQLQSLEGVLETSQNTIKVLLDVIQDLEKKEAERDGRHSYRTGQDIENCGTCRDCACIIYSVEHDFRLQEGQVSRTWKVGDPPEGSPQVTTPQPTTPHHQDTPLPVSSRPATPSTSSPPATTKKNRKKCFWFM